jgi:hypothetical protein
MSATPWLAAIITGTDPGDEVRVDEEGTDWIRFLAEKFRHTDEDGDFSFLGGGIEVLESAE